MSLVPGTRLDNYEVIRPLGAGGMGEVWLAKDLRLERQVALKLLPPDLTADPTRVKRFEQEARAASALNHPNVCTIYALGVAQDGRHLIAMEYVDGDTLRERLLGGPLKRRELLDLAIQIASALSAAHAAGVVHRDLKPENVMVRRDGIVKVLDFGLAKLVASDSGQGPSTQSVYTRAGTVVGTAQYMSPQQARGQTVDARTDVWALGVVLYEMAAGHPPFPGESLSEVLAGILEHEPPPLARFDQSLPHELQRIVTKALRKDPEQRYQVMKDLLLDLQALREETAGSSVPESRSLERSRQIKVTVALVLVLVIVAGLTLWRVRSTARPVASEGSSPPRNYPFTRLTVGPGLQTDPTFSPDGRFIAYAADRAGNFDIWVQPVGEAGDSIQITRSPAADTQPAWSPDGRTIVFRSERDGGGLYVVPALGGPERRLTTFGSWPMWSTQGPEIFFREGLLPWSYGTGSAGARIYVVPAAGGDPHEVVADFLRGGAWRWIAPHPDGRISALGDHRTRKFGFFTVSRGGAHVVTSKLVPLGDEPPAWPLRFQWSPKGTTLYVEATSNVIRTLWRVRVDAETVAWQSAERLTAGPEQDAAATLSSDGTRVAFSRQKESSRAWAFPLETAPTPRITGVGTPLTEEDALIEYPALSPDGRALAYQLRRAGINRSELWVQRLDGTSRELLTTNASGAAWSHDSTKVAYVYLRRDKQPLEAAMAYRRLGGAEHFVSRWTSEFIAGPWDWTPDDRALLGSLGRFMPELPNASLVLWPITNSDADRPERILVRGGSGVNFWQGRFSPNGKWISFGVDRTDRMHRRNEIGVIPADGTELRTWTPVAPDHAWVDKPRWSPDGRILFFISRGPTSYYNLWAVRFDPERGHPVGKPVQLTHFNSPALVYSPYNDINELSVSARHAVLPLLTVTGSIWMLEGVDR
jgi:serine/threonine protein kinase/Tol biopolymer transport system component